jgi:hypothetical protein
VSTCQGSYETKVSWRSLFRESNCHASKMAPGFLQLSDELVLLIFEQVSLRLAPASRQSSTFTGVPYLTTILIGPLPCIEEMLHDLKFVIVPVAFDLLAQSTAVAPHLFYSQRLHISDEHACLFPSSHCEQRAQLDCTC